MACIISITLFYLLVTFLTYIKGHSTIPLHKENNTKNASVIVLFTKTPNDFFDITLQLVSLQTIVCCNSNVDLIVIASKDLPMEW
jgi:uncharacterized membrane protein